MKTFYSWVFIFVASILFSFLPSDTPLDRLIAGFQKYLDELPQEKVYLHFDRPYYASGETIWFKAYLTAGVFHLKSSLSRTLYVELINEEGELVRQLKLLSADGSAPGNIVLSDTLKSGNYLVRAYTHWMKNTGEDYFFHRRIKIWNGSSLPTMDSSPKNDLNVQFFPEGGELVSGILSKVAFKTIAADGLGRQTKGKVVDETGAVVCEFKSNALGMGSFNLTPVKGKTYTAIVEENQSKIVLPTAKESGLTMSIKNSPSSTDLLLRIETRDAADLKTVYVLAQTRGVVCFAARMDLSASVVQAKIAKSKFPSGIAQITIIDQAGIPLAERLVFVEEQEPISIEIKADKPVYAPKELVTLQIQATHTNGKPAVADLSLAVVDDNQVITDDNRESIGAYLLLSSELRGFIESPGYYFNPSNKDRLEALDHLLLTQGWRRFSLKNAMNDRWLPQYKVEKGLTIKGRMLNEESGTPAGDGKVTFLGADAVPTTTTARTNRDGYFEVNDLIYFDSARAIFQGETKNGARLVKFALDKGNEFPLIHFPLVRLTNTQTELEKGFIIKSVEQRNIDRKYGFNEKVIRLKEVEIRGKREDPYEHASKTYGKGSSTLQVAGNAALENQSHALQLLQGRVPGVMVRGVGMVWQVSIRGSGVPMVMIDEVPVPIENLDALSVTDIERVEVWKGAEAAIFGGRGGNGVLGFYTKRGRGFKVEAQGVISFTNMGYQAERQFYRPAYDVKKSEQDHPDKRPTIHWAPMLKTDSTGRISVSFYNHDVETSATCVAEGISTTGTPGASTFKYTIRKN
jgi:hypothetical protein